MRSRGIRFIGVSWRFCDPAHMARCRRGHGSRLLREDVFRVRRHSAWRTRRRVGESHTDRESSVASLLHRTAAPVKPVHRPLELVSDL
ncbi:hypothetical protein EVAR_23709_1 [Eumeta japonica]|uniref:Uncharacterized protein n=1 Tax=Eumeta variegata TaxID=151549 RepID=A0A4C1VGS0_EUMVA|nr:hypothetical protein EVAR_23709_1 [Eumeta japonica]